MHIGCSGRLLLPQFQVEIDGVAVVVYRQNLFREAPAVQI